MGFMADIRNAFTAATSTPGTPPPLLASPLATRPSHLESIVWHELFDAAPRVLTRAEAMSVPTVARARRLLACSIARMDLRVWRGTEEVTPGWLTRTDRDVSPYHRMVWTIDDLIFEGWSLWQLTRGSEAEVLDAARVRPDRWAIDEYGAIKIDDEPVHADDVCLIPGPDEGILSYGRLAIRHAAKLIRAADRAADTPTPTVNLHQTNDYKLTDKEITELIARWSKARRGENGGVAFTSAGIEAREMGAIAEHLLIEGRNAASVDVARAMGIPAAMVDATGPKASLSYETAEGKASEFISYGLAPFMSSVTSRLSLDDMTPRGQRVRFDADALVGPLGPAADDKTSPADGPDSPPPAGLPTTPTPDEVPA